MFGGRAAAAHGGGGRSAPDAATTSKPRSKSPSKKSPPASNAKSSSPDRTSAKPATAPAPSPGSEPGRLRHLWRPGPGRPVRLRRHVPHGHHLPRLPRRRHASIKDKCPDCNGTGRQPRNRTITVKIPPGVHEGQAIRVPGEGEPGTAGGPRGDLHVVISVKEHELFIRENDDLVLRMPIRFTQAALGAKVTVPTLNGEQELTIKPGTQHGDVFRIPGQGLPNLRTGRVGELVVVVLIEIPKKLNDKQKQLLREFAETENHKVMPESRGFWDKIKSYLS